MQTARKAVALARCRSVLVTLVVLSFVPMMVQRCSMPARSQEQRGKLPLPGGITTPGANLSGSGTPQAGGQITKALADSFPDAVSYPATLLESELKGPVADSLWKLSSAGWCPPRVLQLQAYASQTHPLLATLIPRVTFVQARISARGATGYESYAVMDGRPYRLDGLNRLLLDAGFTFDSTEMPTIAKIAVLCATFGNFPPDTNRVGRYVLPPPTRGFPAITFLSARRDTTHPPQTYRMDGVRLQCLVDGVRMSVFVRFTNPDKWGRREVDGLGGGGLQMVPVETRLPPPISPQKHGGIPVRMGSPDSGWLLGVSGDTWTESGGGATHFFLVSDTNGHPTHDTMKFAVRLGSIPDSVFLRFRLMQDTSVHFDSVCEISGDTARLKWVPDYGLTGEYMAFATDTRGGIPMSDSALVDPEAWKTCTLDTGAKTGLIHYMKPNDCDSANGHLNMAQTVEATSSALRTAWNTEAPWVKPHCPVPPQRDTVDVAISHNALAWYHVGRLSNPYTTPGHLYQHECYWTYLPADLDSAWNRFYQPTEVYSSVMAHELWHDCQFALTDPSCVDSSWYDWIVEGTAEAIQTLVYPSLEMVTRGQYRSDYANCANEYLGLSGTVTVLDYRGR
jgi:hypothetical protein